MIPILYEKTKKTFTNDYIGFLTDVIECTVEEGRNDEYELEMTYPISGVLYASIVQDSIIKAKPNNQDNPQPFRVYKITKNSNMTITVNARHIVYDLSKVTVEPFTSTGTIKNAISGMMSHSNPSCGFSFETNKTTAGTYKVSVPSSFRSLMGGVRGSLLDVFGTAEYHYDEYDITLNLNRGSDKGVTIRYGVSMTDLRQEEACEDVYTAVYPFWASGALYMELPERIVSVPGQFPFSRIMTLDLTGEWDSKPTEAQLRSKANSYITEHRVGVPDVSLDVDFSGTEVEQDINLCDIVKVDFEKLGITASAKCIHLTYDVLNERVLSVKLGNYKNTFIDTVTDQMKGITEFASLAPTEIENSIRYITDNGYGYVLLHSSSNTAHIDEILILCDSPNINTAKKIWRWNKNGLGYSSDGYNPEKFDLAMTDGSISANFVKAGIMRSIQINDYYSTLNRFYVTSSGYLNAIKGYIGTATEGFQIENGYLKNSQLKLDRLGLCFIYGSKDIAYLCRTYEVNRSNISQDNTEHYYLSIWADGSSSVLDNLKDDGIGIVLRTPTESAAIALVYYNSASDSNVSVMLFVDNVDSSSGSVTHKQHVRIYKHIYMHGKSFSAYHYTSPPISKYEGFDFRTLCNSSKAGNYAEEVDKGVVFADHGIVYRVQKAADESVTLNLDTLDYE